MAKIKTYHYTVNSNTSFPIDMLRYDNAYPATCDAVSAIEHSRNPRRLGEQYKVALVGTHEPTVERWNSFNWRVGDVEIRRN